MSTSYMKRRKDINPEEGVREYGLVEFADPTNNKYPIDTSEHIRAAWRYIHQKRNAQKYDEDELQSIKDRIRMAADEHDIPVEEE